MKTILALMITALFTLTAHALDDCYDGSWYDSDRDGEGITVSALDDGRTLAYFYTFGSEGRAWYVMVGTDKLTMYGSNKQSDEPFVAAVAEVGTATLTPIDGDTLTFTYDLEFDVDRDAAIPWCLGSHCSGSYTYTRLAGAEACE